MRYCVDIDSTICTPGTCGNCVYEGSRAMGRSSMLPHDEAKEKAEQLLKPLTKCQLDIWGCKYHELIFGKPHADIFIDDKAMNSEDYFERD